MVEAEAAEEAAATEEDEVAAADSGAVSARVKCTR
jgi:hypothetical protein